MKFQGFNQQFMAFCFTSVPYGAFPLTLFDSALLAFSLFPHFFSIFGTCSVAVEPILKLMSTNRQTLIGQIVLSLEHNDLKDLSTLVETEALFHKIGKE